MAMTSLAQPLQHNRRQHNAGKSTQTSGSCYRLFSPDNTIRRHLHDSFYQNDDLWIERQIESRMIKRCAKTEVLSVRCDRSITLPRLDLTCERTKRTNDQRERELSVSCWFAQLSSECINDEARVVVTLGVVCLFIASLAQPLQHNHSPRYGQF